MDENQHRPVNMLIPTTRSLLRSNALFSVSGWSRNNGMLKVSKYLLRASYIILVWNQGQTRRTELDGPLHINTSGRKCLEANHCSLSKSKTICRYKQNTQQKENTPSSLQQTKGRWYSINECPDAVCMGIECLLICSNTKISLNSTPFPKKQNAWKLNQIRSNLFM